MSNHPSWRRSLFPRIPDPTEEKVRRLLEPYYPELCQVVMAPWQDLQQRRLTDPAFRRRRGKDLAWWLHGEMVNQARTIFVNHPIKPTRLRNGQFALRCRDELLITVKKLNRRRLRRRERLSRSNYLTHTNRDYHDQRRCPDIPTIPRVVLGYILKREETEIEVVIAYPRTQERDFLWHYDVPGQADGGLRLAPRPPAGPTEDSPKKGFTVTPKKDVRESDKK